MSPASALAPVRSAAPAAPAARAPGPIADYVALTKPRVALLVLATVAAGAWVGGGGAVALPVLVHALLGTALVAGGASAWNQLLERESDGRMLRTRDRPLPAGRLRPRDAAIAGTLLSAAGLAWLALAVSPLCAALAALTGALYAGAYTPLKSRTTVHVLVGAVAGALPPVIGWASATGGLGPGALSLFLVLFLWQLPHVLALGTIYRDDYERAGILVLPSGTIGAPAGRHALGAALALLPASLWPASLGLAGPRYALAALLLGIFYAALAAAFAWRPDSGRARPLFRASLVHLPTLLLVLALDAGHGAGAGGHP
ncbi:MAG: heme o synthase [Planctomycetales bacterium]|nr:heme o synthase [Planctomycetales bacterium]